MRSRFATLRLATLALAAVSAVACGKQIGDSCNTNIDCSLNADRQCDLSQIGGYCTIPQCTPDSCPSEAMCIEFESAVPRLSRRYCVKHCSQDSDCRGGYYCAGLHSSATPIVGPHEPCPDPGNDTQTSTASTCARLVDLLSADGGRPSVGYCVQMPTM
jgi:hypothetical protein